jgi:hypothetical protein
MVEDVKRLVSLFAPQCAERGTIDELARMLEDKKQWVKAHDLFDRIRRKKPSSPTKTETKANRAVLLRGGLCPDALQPERRGHAIRQGFAVLHNPIAVGLARALKIDDSRILEIVLARRT